MLSPSCKIRAYAGICLRACFYFVASTSFCNSWNGLSTNIQVFGKPCSIVCLFLSHPKHLAGILLAVGSFGRLFPCIEVFFFFVFFVSYSINWKDTLETLRPMKINGNTQKNTKESKAQVWYLAEVHLSSSPDLLLFLAGEQVLIQNSRQLESCAFGAGCLLSIQ